MNRELRVSLFDLATSLSNAMDLINSDLVDHHKRVAYIALRIVEELKLPPEEVKQIVLAGILHDVGALSFEERLTLKQYENQNAHHHAEVGYWLLQTFAPMEQMAKYVRYHHHPWDMGNGAVFEGEPVPLGSHVLHLADRIEILINRQQEILGQVNRIVETVNQGRGTLYSPGILDAFMAISNREYFWLDITSANVGKILANNTDVVSVQLQICDLLEFSKLFSQIIDFRSSFTSTHSSGVAYTSEAIAQFIGLSDRECKMMRIAGFLHDIGKLAIPKKILEKPGKLELGEFNVMRSHTYHTYRVLNSICGFDLITEWASYHHEKLNGQGYPFHLTEEHLSLGARIMAVADVFTAIAEDRPYRDGLEKQEILSILYRMVATNSLDAHVVHVLENNYTEINEIRIHAQLEADAMYREFKDKVAKLTE